MTDIGGILCGKESILTGEKSSLEGLSCDKESILTGEKKIDIIVCEKLDIMVSNEESSPIVEDIDTTRGEPKLKRSIP